MAKLATVKLDQLHFDPENPRLPMGLRHQDDDAVLEYLLLEGNLIELMLSIGEHGFFLGEPLLVVPRAEGGFIVVEGNRRLGALKLLASDGAPPVMAGQVRAARESAREKPNDIPVLEFTQRDDILGYLGYRHITGIKEWDSLAKARYLRQLRERHADKTHVEAHKALAKEIGSKAPHVAKLLTGLSLLERARDLGLFGRMKVDEDTIPFSLLTTAIGYPNICGFIGLDGASDVDGNGLKNEEFSEFFGWVFDKSRGSHTVLVESRNLDKLNRVVANQKALEELRRGESLAHADLYTEGPLEALRNFLRDAEASIKSAQTTLSAAEGLEKADMAQADRIKKSASALFASIQDLMSEEE